MPIKTNDIYYLAGWLEGEGCFFLYRRPTYTAVGIQGTSTDEDTVRYVSQLLGTNIHYYKPKNPNWSPSWSFTITGKQAAEWMMTLYPLMGNRRQEKIRECLQAWKTECPGRWGWKGKRRESKKTI